jgi:hypothetical protein
VTRLGTRGRLVTAGLALLTVAGCHAGSHPTVGAGSSAGSAGSTATSPAAPGSGLAGGGGETSAPRSTIVTTPRPSLTTPNGVSEVEGSCPYITAQEFADGEGDMVGRVTVLESRPVGCRFYFRYDPTVVVGEITIDVFGTKTEAYNAMVLSAKGHPEVQSDPSIGDGAVLFTAPLQGSPTWQCVFAKGTRVVTVRTRQPYPALNAENLAREIVPKIG